jgi:hypothetical protein
MALPPEEASRETLVGRRRVNLVRLARAQRTLLRLVLAMLALYISMPFIAPVFAGVGGEVGMILYVLVLAALGVCIVVQTVRLSMASGDHPALAVIVGLLMLVPLAGLIVVAIVDRGASRTLKTNGARVGLMGVSAAEMTKLTEGYCHKCGYPLAGLTANLCPECGAPIR